MDEKSSKEQEFIDKYDVDKFLVSVHNKYDKDITADFVLAKFNEEKDKIYIVDMYKCANDCVNLIDEILSNHVNLGAKGFIKQLTKEELTTIKVHRRRVLETFMKKINMLAVVNRNVSNNWLIKYLKTMPIPDESPNVTDSVMDDIKKKFANQERRDDMVQPNHIQ